MTDREIKNKKVQLKNVSKMRYSHYNKLLYIVFIISSNFECGETYMHFLKCTSLIIGGVWPIKIMEVKLI